MARGAAPPGDDSSSSGFSSDEDMADVSNLPSSSFSASSVHVEVLQEVQESSPENAPGSVPSAVAARSVPQCCQEASDLILQASNPLDVQYEQFMTAIGHVTWHWPTSETLQDPVALENATKASHSVRAELYKAFQKAFPLTEDMYAQWVADCAARGDSDDQVKSLLELSRADYWSVPLTLQYLRLVNDSGGDEELETAMQKAQTTLGAHFARGHEVWALCRELTTEKFDEMDGDVEAQKEKAIRELYCKQMQLPLDQNDLVMSEFRAWDAYNTLDAEAAGSAFERASTRQSKLFAPLMKKLRGFEARISAAPGTEDAAAPEQAWLQYLNFVKHRVAPLVASGKAGGASAQEKHIVVSLYERAVAVMCLSPTLWASYLAFLEPDEMESTEDGAEKLAVAQRAVRNVPFDSSAWTQLLVEMERSGEPAEEIAQLVRTKLLARSSPPMDQYHLLSVLLAWCDSVRRHASTSIGGGTLDETVQQVETVVGGVFSECEQYMRKVFPAFQEGGVRLTEYRAKCYWALMPPQGPPRLTPATAMKVSKVNELWKSTLATPVGDQAAAWTSYLEVIRRMGAFSTSSIREMVFGSAVQRVKDAPLVLAEAWLVFERESGDLTSYLRARQYHVKHQTSAQAAAASQAVAPAERPANTEGIKKAKSAKKRKANAPSEGAKNAKGPQKTPAAKRAKRNESKLEDDGAAPRDVDKPKPAAAVEKQKVHESLTNEHTLFLCNVSKDATKEDIEALFNDIPTLKDVRLVVKARGERVKSRGMAYVQFTDEAGVEAGLKKDGVLLDGHPLRVERSKPPATSASTPAAGKQGREGFWKTDPVTLFVGALNREGSKDQVTEEQLQVALQQAMQESGGLVGVARVAILKDRHGKLKNYGLVEVAEPAQVAFCLANMPALQGKLGKQVTVKPSRFSIAHILEQQEKQHKQKQPRKAGDEAGKGANAPHARPSTRLAVGSATSLMPRALRRKLAAQRTASKMESSEAGADAATVAPKSNEDFRKMLFNK
jgi:RNA recognition motif-containing protein